MSFRRVSIEDTTWMHLPQNTLLSLFKMTVWDSKQYFRLISWRGTLLTFNKKDCDLIYYLCLQNLEILGANSVGNYVECLFFRSLNDNSTVNRRHVFALYAKWFWHSLKRTNATKNIIMVLALSVHLRFNCLIMGVQPDMKRDENING